MIFLQFRYKRRIFRHLHLQDEKKLQKVNTKKYRKKFFEHIYSRDLPAAEKLLKKGLDPNFHDEKSGGKIYMLFIRIIWFATTLRRNSFCFFNTLPYWLSQLIICEINPFNPSLVTHRNTTLSNRHVGWLNGNDEDIDTIWNVLGFSDKVWKNCPAQCCNHR